MLGLSFLEIGEVLELLDFFFVRVIAYLLRGTDELFIRSTNIGSSTMPSPMKHSSRETI